MNKKVKIVIGVIIGIIILWAIIFSIDYYKVSNFEMPIFVIKIYEESGAITYQGLGYKVETETAYYSNGVETDKEILTKVEMYMFNKFITGAVSDVTSNNTVDGTNTEETYPSFRAIVIESKSSYIIVEPIEGEDRFHLSDRVSVGLGENNDALYTEGAELLITYTGEVMESEPTQINVIKIQTETEYKTKIEDLPQDYTVTQAVNDNCIVTTNDNKIYNKDELDRFLENVDNNNPDFMRWVCFTDEGDMLITDVIFEGSNSFRVTTDYTRDKFSSGEDRTYTEYRFSKLETSKNNERISIELNGALEGDLDSLIICFYGENDEVINNYMEVKLE